MHWKKVRMPIEENPGNQEAETQTEVVDIDK
jgi:hypothetical protein